MSPSTLPENQFSGQHAVIYTRQSKDRDGLGAAVSRQLDECRVLAARNDLEVTAEYSDNDVSASKGTRPEFSNLLRAIRAGQVSTIIVWHTDRLYRRVRDLVELVELAEKHALRILTVKAGDLDLNNSTGRMLAQIMGAVARQEVEHKSERQITANIQRAEAGVWQFSNRPYGYERVDGIVQIIESEAAVLREAYDRYLAGETYYAISEDLNDRGLPTTTGKPWTITQLRERLKNPAYAGIRTYKGEIVAMAEAKWEPIISLETWERFTMTKARRRTQHDWSNKTKYLLSGLAICGICGSRMMARPEYQRRKDAPKVTVMTYQCIKNWCVSRNLTRVDDYVQAVLFARLSLPDAAEALTPRGPEIGPLVAESIELRARRDDLAGLLADGTLTAGAVRESSAKLQARLEVVQQQIAAAEGGGQLSALVMADDIGHHWETQLTLPQQRSVINALFTVTIVKQKNTRVFDPEDVVIEWKTP